MPCRSMVPAENNSAGRGADEPSLALVMCIRNEERFLAANLAYHRSLGVKRAYIFLDRCTDASPEIARAFPWVEAIERDRDPADRYMSAHQVKCLSEGLQMARRDGVDWLMHVDADEFACGDDRSEYARLATRLAHGLLPLRRRPPETVGALPAMLARAAPATEMVVMRSKDVLPMCLPASAPFWKLRFFQLGGQISRSMLDPMTGQVRKLENRIGGYHGKSIVRVDADVAAASAHRWKRRGLDLPDEKNHAAAEASLRTEQRGFLYHYTVVSAAHWLEKHRKFAEYPSHWEKGTPVRFPKQAWKEASVRMSAAEAQAYFDEWIALPPHRLLWPLLRGHVAYETFVDDVLTRVQDGSLPTARAPLFAERPLFADRSS